MTTRIGINGFGRIGRDFLRVAQGTDLEIVAVPATSASATTPRCTSRRAPGR